MSGYWEELQRPAPDAVTVAGGELRAGTRVRLRPRAGGDVMDIVLDGRTAIIEAVEQDTDGAITLAVVVEDDPGRDLGLARQPGHRFFFSPEELEWVGDPETASATAGATPRILVAGIGNVFLGDDGFGVALADRLWRRPPTPGVDVVDFGIRGMDLAFAMQDGYDAVVLLDAAPRGEAPGTLYVIEVDDTARGATVDAHGMDPLSVIGLVRSFGGAPPPVYLVGCEPESRMAADAADVVATLSEPVRAALGPAEELVQTLLAELGARPHTQEVQEPS